MTNLTRIKSQLKDQKPKFIETELGTEKLCIECQEYWPLDVEFWFLRRTDGVLIAKFTNGTYLSDTWG